MANGGQLKLSATELRELTNWNEAVILEFLSLQSAVSTIINNINIVTNNFEASNTVNLQAQVTGLRRGLLDLQQLLEGLNLVRLQARITNNSDALANLQQEVAGGA
jgi:hypothetical protein